MTLPDTCSECPADAAFYRRETPDGPLVPYCATCVPAP